MKKTQGELSWKYKRKSPGVIVFDMDDTLTKSLSIADSEMIELFEKLSLEYKVWIITWWTFERINNQIIWHLDGNKANLNNIYLFPTNWTRMLSFKWEGFLEDYSEDLKENEVDLIVSILNKAIKDLDLLPEKQYWKIIDNRWSQITYAALGQDVPLEIKEVWDPDFKKRLKVREYIKDDLKDFGILLWGRASIDITRAWVDKAYAIRKIMKILNIDKSEILFIWDALMEGWNDYPVKAFWVDTIQVENPEDTKKEIKKFI